MPLHCVLVRPHLKYSVQFWIPGYEKTTDTLKHVQQRATKMLARMEHLYWRDRLRKWCLFSVEKRQLLRDCQYVRGGGTRLFTAAHGERMTNNGLKLKQESFRVDIMKNFSPCQAEKQVSREAVMSLSFELFKT